MHRLRRAAARQQAGIADGARSPGDPAPQPLGVDPAQRMPAEIELAGIVADDDGIV
jgi:hypothetical protein